MTRNVFVTTVLTGLMFMVTAPASLAQQWKGSENEVGAIWRSGSIKIGGPQERRGSGAALLEMQHDLTGERDLLISAKYVFQGNTSSIFEVDTKGVYVGGATNKVSLLPSGTYDLAVGRGMVVGLNSVTDRVPADYALAVGGKVLAEEVRIKQVTDWPDYVLKPDYVLAPLAEVRDYIAMHHHLPDVPSASEVSENGVGLGEMQVVLLRKIEELTLHLI
ncbi:MAG: hypothetical protein WBN88_16375, partial [Anderseniella sp.]